jgi:hypothetical protein
LTQKSSFHELIRHAFYALTSKNFLTLAAAAIVDRRTCYSVTAICAYVGPFRCLLGIMALNQWCSGKILFGGMLKI